MGQAGASFLSGTSVCLVYRQPHKYLGYVAAVALRQLSAQRCLGQSDAFKFTSHRSTAVALFYTPASTGFAGQSPLGCASKKAPPPQNLNPLDRQGSSFQGWCWGDPFPPRCARRSCQVPTNQECFSMEGGPSITGEKVRSVGQRTHSSRVGSTLAPLFRSSFSHLNSTRGATADAIQPCSARCPADRMLGLQVCKAPSTGTTKRAHGQTRPTETSGGEWRGGSSPDWVKRVFCEGQVEEPTAMARKESGPSSP